MGQLCPKCNEFFERPQKFCSKCGEDLSRFVEKCPKCGRETIVNANFCGTCGLDLFRDKEDMARIKCAREYLEDCLYDRAINELRLVINSQIRSDEVGALLEEARVSLVKLKQHKERAEDLIARGKLREAQYELEKAQQLNPRDQDTAFLLRKVTSENLETFLQEARRRRTTGDFEGVIDFCERILGLDANNREAQSLKIEAHERICTDIAQIREKIQETRSRLRLDLVEGWHMGCCTEAEEHEQRGLHFYSCGSLVLARKHYETALHIYAHAIEELEIYEGLSLQINNTIGMDLVLIPAGTFLMGSPAVEGNADEHPEHEVELTRPFYMATTPVTQAQWAALMPSNPSKIKGNILPVENVTWSHALEFIEKLSKVEGRCYRLPTEAEWEYACRSGSRTTYHFGNDAKKLEEYAWYRNNSNGSTHPVRSRKPNRWGLYDMHGNVWEWCSDWYDENYYKNSPTVDPKGPNSGRFRVVRGGSWYYSSTRLTAARRSPSSPRAGSGNVGFRCARDLT
jgi:formylglycine-generating enzyme required for sulfatase activity